MKTKRTVAVALVLSAVSISSAWSTDKAKTNAGDDMAQHVQRQAVEPVAAAVGPETATRAGSQAAIFGGMVPASTASRTVALAPEMKYVNVASGETVTFKSGGQEATWKFAESIRGTSVDLGVMLPGMPNAQGVRVHIERSRLFTGH
ncbi:CzcE family metal-binding protein (plasmid) [Cupriavidus sp. P-10]|uniref:CzcE family metal-binding protein n=1 Tax=Cupriavidus sp. P-10 TaxID=2027911 RepID=UPI0013143191|nr:CzcE family metal-binding protein [Cupriavidus sp. P-10]BDB29219.1 CzcE family metal-binding protein [Cupriavidus sp. P-10]